MDGGQTNERIRIIRSRRSCQGSHQAHRHPARVGLPGLLQQGAEKVRVGLLRPDDQRKQLRVHHLPQLEHGHRHKQHERDAQHPVEKQRPHEVLRHEARSGLAGASEERQGRGVQAHSQQQGQKQHLEREKKPDLILCLYV